MSNNDSLDEETKRILAEVDTDDSEETIKKKISKKANDDYNIYETNTLESDDKDW